MSNFMLAKLRSVIREETSTVVDAFEDRLLLILGRYAQQVDKRFDELENRMDRVEDRLTGVETRLTAVEDRVGILARKFDVLTERVDDHGVHLERLEAKCN